MVLNRFKIKIGWWDVRHMCVWASGDFLIQIMIKMHDKWHQMKGTGKLRELKLIVEQFYPYPDLVNKISYKIF